MYLNIIPYDRILEIRMNKFIVLKAKMGVIMRLVTQSVYITLYYINIRVFVYNVCIYTACIVVDIKVPLYRVCVGPTIVTQWLRDTYCNELSHNTFLCLLHLTQVR